MNLEIPAWRGRGLMLVELSVVEQRYHAVLEVFKVFEVLEARLPVVEVAARCGAVVSSSAPTRAISANGTTALGRPE
jgi:hypothetical protein